LGPIPNPQSPIPKVKFTFKTLLRLIITHNKLIKTSLSVTKLFYLMK
jgi:hypothetical protein